MDEKKFVICQGKWPLTPALPVGQAESEIIRLSEWFSGLNKVEVCHLQPKLQEPIGKVT